MAQSGLPTMEQALENPLDRTNIMGLNSHFPRSFWDFSGAVAANVIICRMRCKSFVIALSFGIWEMLLFNNCWIRFPHDSDKAIIIKASVSVMCLSRRF